MALDGAFLACLRQEFEHTFAEARVDKIHQPGRDELVLLLRNRQGSYRLYISIGNMPRIHLISEAPENPQQPPMFCMLLRKWLTGAKLIAIRQIGLERALYWDFESINELGDVVRLTLAVELMGHASNVILIQDGRIMDAMRRIDPDASQIRPILPGLRYELPPLPGGKRDLSRHTAEEFLAGVKEHGELPLSKALLNASLGMSPLLCREIAFRTAGGDPVVNDLTAEQWENLKKQLTNIRNLIEGGATATPYRIDDLNGEPTEYSFLPITQYGLTACGQESASFSALLDDFYRERALAERIRLRSRDLMRTLRTNQDRIHRKLDHQRQELADSANRDTFRLYGDLINAHLSVIPAGCSEATLTNYYDEACAPIRVPLDPSLSANANARKYYKEYRKAQTAEQVLQGHITAGEEELLYLESVSDALSRAKTVRELDAIRTELEEQGYLRPTAKQNGKSRAKTPAVQPLVFRSDDGFIILVGRNNRENDRITLQTARGSDIWMHVKNSPGSHVVIVTEGQTPPDRTLEQAAVLAATHSKASSSSQVPVDYTAVRYVKKPSGAKPGRVIYTDYRTAFVDPDPALSNRLRQE